MSGDAGKGTRTPSTSWPSSPPVAPAAPPAGRGGTPAPLGGDGGLREYLSAMSMLEGSVAREGGTRLSAAEVRRHTTGRMVAIPDAEAGAGRPTTGRMPLIPDGGNARAGRRSSIGERSAPRRSRGRLVLPGIAVLLTVAVVGARIHGPAPSAELPVALRGEWVTTHPLYATRRLTFTAHAIGIAVGAARVPRLLPVRAVEVTTGAALTRVEIVYEEDGAGVPFQLQYSAVPPRRLILANPPDVVWTPATDDVPVPSAPTSSAPTSSAPTSSVPTVPQPPSPEPAPRRR